MASSTRRGGGGARQSPFFRDLASPIPSHRAASRFAPTAAAQSATPPPPPLFTLDDRVAAADFSPDPVASDVLPVASSPSPRAGASRSPSWERSRGRASAPGSPMDGVVVPPRKEVLALPPPSSPGTPPPPPPAAEAQSPVTPASVAAGTEQAMNGGVHSYDARKALQKNGILLSSGVIVGVKPIDPTHRQQLAERLGENKQGGFMVSLPSKSLVLKGAGASNQLGALPRPYDPKANNTNAIRDASRRATGSVAAPAKSLVTNVMDLIFGI
ncbi:hypothetical protein ABZP36_030686 [Zizania latifolia]